MLAKHRVTYILGRWVLAKCRKVLAKCRMELVNCRTVFAERPAGARAIHYMTRHLLLCLHGLLCEDAFSIIFNCTRFQGMFLKLLELDVSLLAPGSVHSLTPFAEYEFILDLIGLVRAILILVPILDINEFDIRSFEPPTGCLLRREHGNVLQLGLILQPSPGVVVVLPDESLETLEIFLMNRGFARLCNHLDIRIGRAVDGVVTLVS